MDGMLPSSGEEYLRLVRAQARSCPAVVIAPRAHEYLSVKNTSRKYRTDWNSCRPAPEGCAPSPEWRDQFMREFLVARASLKKRKEIGSYDDGSNIDVGTATTALISTEDYMSESGSASKRKKSQLQREDDGNDSIMGLRASSTARRTHQVAIPKMFDEQGWRTLIYGSTTRTTTISTSTWNPTAQAEVTTVVIGADTPQKTTLTSVALGDTTVNIPSPYKVDPTVATTVEATETTSTLMRAMQTPDQEEQGMMPQPQFLTRLHQGHLMQLLKYHLRWMAEDDVTDHEGRWLYAIFMKLDPLVESDQTSILRSLAKKCSRIRSHLNRDSGSKLATVNMVITIVARLFGQSDLE
ncbi:gem (nuclear organelle) associated protein 2 [Dissophora globulifera]|nr:gem (nuclear organelle) associated protein 2 [Dissophora globulifera]